MIRRRIICMVTVVVLISSFLSVSGPHEKTARAAVSWTLATTVDPVLLYEAAAGVQPLVLSLCDQDNVPVDTTAITDLAWSYGSPATFVQAAPPRLISSGYWLFTGTPATEAKDVRFAVSGTVGGVPLASNMVIITPRTLGGWNPQLLVMTHDSLLQNKGGYLLYGKHVFDRLPCTIGNSFDILSVLYTPKNVEKSPGYTIKRVVNNVSGSVTKGVAAAWPVENANILADFATGNKYLVNGVGAISVRLDTEAWEFADPACQTFDDGRNAIPHTYVKTFKCGEAVLPVTVKDITFSSNGDGTHDVHIAFQGPCDRPAEWAVDITALKTDGSVDERFGTAGHVWYNGIPASQSPSATGIAYLPGQGLAGSDGALPTSSMKAASNCSNLILQSVDFAGVWGDTLAFWMYGNQESTGATGWTHPAAFAGTFGVTAPFLETTIAGATSVKTLVAGVSQKITMTGVAFSVGTPSWTTTLDGSADGITQYKPVASTSGSWTVDMSPALPRAGKLTLTGVAVDTATGKRETATVSWDVVMPEFTVTIDLSDGTTIANDHTLTDGGREILVVAATNPLTKAPIEVWWEFLSAKPNVGVGGVPTCVIWVSPHPGGSLITTGIKNPYLSDEATVDIYAMMGGAEVHVDTLVLKPCVLTITPNEVPVTWSKPTATDLLLHGTDAHAHPLAGAFLEILGLGVTIITDKAGDAYVRLMPFRAGTYFTYLQPHDLQWPAGGSTCVFDSWKASGAETTGAPLYIGLSAPVVDTTVPMITVSQGIDGTTVNSTAFTITGKATDDVGVVQLFVGMNKVNVSSDGSFTTSVTLLEGKQTITLTAYDAAGNKATASVIITYQPPVAPPVQNATVIVLAIGSATATVNGISTSLDAAPEIVSNRTFVPIRFISEAFGASVDWAPATKSITISLGSSTLGLQIGSTSSVVNGLMVSLPAAPYIKNGRTMVPLRLISEGFGGDVVWDPAARTVTITYTAP